MNGDKPTDFRKVIATLSGPQPGLMAARVRDYDWAKSPLGDRQGWPASLTAMCSLMFDSKFPMFVAWGEALTFLYNDGYADLLGDKHPGALGARFQDVWQEIWSDIAPLAARALDGEATWIEDHHLRVHRHGYLEDAWFTFSYSPARDDAGNVAGMFCVVTETTARVVAEASLRDLNQTLEARVDERSRLLQNAQEQLRQSQKFEAIGQLTGGVAHDFNNLLTVIRGSVELLRRGSIAEDRRRLYLDAIDTTADRAAKLTSQLLAFARRQTLKPEAFDARTALEEIVDVIRTVTGPSIVIDLRTPDEHCCILADRGQFDAAIINLILNGRDAMNGEGRLSLVVAPAPMIPSAAPVEGDFVAVTVTDAGVGIAEQDLARIFEPFFTTKKVGSGSGLGLSQAIGFARQSGGDVRVRSAKGHGASFTLYLPRTYPDGAVSRTTAAEPSADVRAGHVLVVEDNEAVGMFAVNALQELGFQTVLAPDAACALATLADNAGRFDALFSDVVMPGMSGLELANEVRRLYPHIPIVLASGYSETLAQNGAQGHEFLPKPYAIEELASKLANAIASGAPAPLIVEVIAPPAPGPTAR